MRVTSASPVGVRCEALSAIVTMCDQNPGHDLHLMRAAAHLYGAALFSIIVAMMQSFQAVTQMIFASASCPRPYWTLTVTSGVTIITASMSVYHRPWPGGVRSPRERVNPA